MTRIIKVVLNPIASIDATGRATVRDIDDIVAPYLNSDMVIFNQIAAAGNISNITDLFDRTVTSALDENEEADVVEIRTWGRGYALACWLAAYSIYKPTVYVVNPLLDTADSFIGKALGIPKPSEIIPHPGAILDLNGDRMVVSEVGIQQTYFRAESALRALLGTFDDESSSDSDTESDEDSSEEQLT